MRKRSIVIQFRLANVFNSEYKKQREQETGRESDGKSNKWEISMEKGSRSGKGM